MPQMALANTFGNNGIAIKHAVLFYRKKGCGIL